MDVIWLIDLIDIVDRSISAIALEYGPHHENIYIILYYIVHGKR